MPVAKPALLKTTETGNWPVFSLKTPPYLLPRSPFVMQTNFSLVLCGLWSFIGGPCFVCLWWLWLWVVFGLRPGLFWSLVLGLWSFGLWYLVFGFWFFGLLVFGFWFLVFGLWSLVFECFGSFIFMCLWVVFGLFGLWSLIVVLVVCLRSSAFWSVV